MALSGRALAYLAESPALRDFFSLFQLIRFEMDVDSHVLVGRRTLTLSTYLNRTGLISEGLQRTVIRELSYPHRKFVYVLIAVVVQNHVFGRFGRAKRKRLHMSSESDVNIFFSCCAYFFASSAAVHSLRRERSSEAFDSF